MKCEYCDSPLAYEISECPRCGAPCKFVPRPSDAVLETEQLMNMQKAEQQKKAQADRDNNKELIQMSNIDISFLEQNRKDDAATTKRTLWVIGVIAVVVIIFLLASC